MKSTLNEFVSFLLCGAIATVICVSAPGKNATVDEADGILNIEDDNYFYFFDAARKNRSAAATFCKTADANAVLGIITGPAIYNRLRLGTFPPVGTYWINGQDFGNVNERFKDITSDCEDDKNLWSLDGVPVALPATFCLALIKETDILKNRIEAVNCGNLNGVLCSLPLTDCGNPVTEDILINDFNDFIS